MADDANASWPPGRERERSEAKGWERRDRAGKRSLFSELCQGPLWSTDQVNHHSDLHGPGWQVRSLAECTPASWSPAVSAVSSSGWAPCCRPDLKKARPLGSSAPWRSSCSKGPVSSPCCDVTQLSLYLSVFICFFLSLSFILMILIVLTSDFMWRWDVVLKVKRMVAFWFALIVWV